MAPEHGLVHHAGHVFNSFSRENEAADREPILNLILSQMQDTL